MKQFIISLFLLLSLSGCEAVNQPEDDIQNLLNKCELVPDTGSCKAAFTKYYFDSESRTCKEFIWGGCDGEVPFHTLDACCECAATACSGGSENDPEASILFVGNSLTYSNDLPDLVERIGTRNQLSIETEMLAFPNYAIEDHWNDGQLQALIVSKRFTHVIMQQGPSSQADGRIMLLDYGARIKALCDQNETKLAFFMVWPARVNYHTFDGVIANYTLAAEETKSILCPVGKVWKEHFDSTNDFSYYGPDQFHPSLKGSEVAAEVIYKTIFE